MTLDDFAILVRRCRKAQTHYFRDRSQDALAAARVAERLVDRAVAEVLRQPELFDEPTAAATPPCPCCGGSGRINTGPGDYGDEYRPCPDCGGPRGTS